MMKITIDKAQRNSWLDFTRLFVSSSILFALLSNSHIRSANLIYIRVNARCLIAVFFLSFQLQSCRWQRVLHAIIKSSSNFRWYSFSFFRYQLSSFCEARNLIEYKFKPYFCCNLLALAIRSYGIFACSCKAFATKKIFWSAYNSNYMNRVGEFGAIKKIKNSLLLLLFTEPELRQ